MFVYVLVKVAPGKENHVLNKILENEKVLKVTEVLGPFDMVVEVDVENEKELEDIVIEYIRNIDGVIETITLVSVRSKTK